MSFGTAARRQQARFRESLPSDARSPDDDVGRRNGHLLAHGHELQNLAPGIRAEALALFRSRRVPWWRSGRSGDRALPEGQDLPTRNLASSQVACVNMLLPLAVAGEGKAPEEDPLLTLLRLLDPAAEAVLPVPDPDGMEPSRVEFEWVGWDRPIEGGPKNRGALQTSADALLYGLRAGRPWAWIFEWKYVEEYLRPSDMGAGRSGQTRRRAYTPLYTRPDSAFRPDVPLDDFFWDPCYQLMRLRLLADRTTREGVAPHAPVAGATVVVVCPLANDDYRRPVTTTPLARRFPDEPSVEGLMRRTLRDPEGLCFGASEALVEGMRRSGLGGVVPAWVAWHAGRYGW